MTSAAGAARARPELAALRFSLAVLLDPQLAPAQLGLANALAQADRLQSAIDVLRSISSSSPWKGQAYLQEASLLDSLGQPDEALEAADRALAASRRREILIGVADLNRLHGHLLRAAQLYDEVIASDAAAGEPDWQIMFARASALKLAGNWTQAEAQALEALVLAPDRPELLNFLGYAWVDQGVRIEDGLSYIRKAAALRPDEGYILDSLGWAYFKLGRYEDAIVNLERAAEIEPANTEILDHLGDAYWRVGRYAEAVYKWSAALSFNPKDGARSESLRNKRDRGLPALPPGRLDSQP